MIVYNETEREEILRKMRAAINNFYADAVRTGCHPFIEFAGLMGEHLVMCEAAHKQGLDFTQANVHTGQPLPMERHNVEYLGEKLGCIYGPALNEEKSRALLDAIGRR